MRRLAALLLAGLLAGSPACAGDHARYGEAVARMDELAVRVDAGFDRVAPHAEAVFSDTAWDDPEALIRALDAARSGMAEVLAAQDERIRVERSILELAALDRSPDTRMLYHMDLDAQQAKRDLFAVTLEMYQALAKEARAGDRDAFEELARVYRSGVDAGNRRFRELDQRRQEQQQAVARENPAI